MSRFAPLLRLLAVLAVFGTMWQSAAGQLEHLGLIPHAHPIASEAGDTPDNPFSEHHGLAHHHHLSDLDAARTTIFLTGAASLLPPIPQPAALAPEAPVFGIDRPPRLS